MTQSELSLGELLLQLGEATRREEEFVDRGNSLLERARCLAREVEERVGEVLTRTDTVTGLPERLPHRKRF